MTISKEVPIFLKIHLDNMKNIIEVQHLKYKYDNHANNYILKDVTFHVKQGEWLSIDRYWAQTSLRALSQTPVD